MKSILLLGSTGSIGTQTLDLVRGPGSGLRVTGLAAARSWKKLLEQATEFQVPLLASQPLTADYLAAQDCVLIATDHSAYDYDFIVQHAPLVIDTRNATREVVQGREKIVKA